MRVHDFHRDPGQFRPVDRYSHLRLSGVTSPAEVLEVVSSLRRNDPEARFLCTLDDLDQCCYTSAHAAEDERLGLASVEDDDPRAFEAERLRLIAEKLDDPASRVAWDALPGTLFTAAGNVDALVAVNRAPEVVLDEVVYVQRLPVARDDLLIAGLPNGYFSADWDVFHNHAVIRRLHDAHGYRFFGIGASWLGFVRDRPLTPDQAAAVVRDLVHLYGWGSSPAWPVLGDLLHRTGRLFLGYTENFAESLS